MENKIKHHSPLGSLAFWISVFSFFPLYVHMSTDDMSTDDMVEVPLCISFLFFISPCP